MKEFSATATQMHGLPLYHLTVCHTHTRHWPNGNSEEKNEGDRTGMERSSTRHAYLENIGKRPECHATPASLKEFREGKKGGD